MKTLLLDVYDNTVTEVDIKNELSAFYEVLKCEIIQIVPRHIGYPNVKMDTKFLVMCDEEGALKEDQKVSAINGKGDPMFVGNLMFFRQGEDGDLKELSEKDIKYLKRKIWDAFFLFEGRRHVLVQCEY